MLRLSVGNAEFVYKLESIQSHSTILFYLLKLDHFNGFSGEIKRIFPYMCR